MGEAVEGVIDTWIRPMILIAYTFLDKNGKRWRNIVHEFIRLFCWLAILTEFIFGNNHKQLNQRNCASR